MLRAVDDVSLTIEPGETLGLVGESGCGKSTLARSLIHVTPPTAGRIIFNGEDVSTPNRQQLRRLRQGMQMVFQDPYGSLNPRLTAGATLAEVLRVHAAKNDKASKARVAELLELVGLDPNTAGRFPHEFSGGQRQRLGIARALAVKPRLLLADEPVSALDVSVQAQIVNLLQDLKEKLGIACLFIAHDLAVVEHISDRVAVMYLGRIVECAPARELYENPKHPYTQILFSAVPGLSPAVRPHWTISGDVPSPVNVPEGCAFQTRCPQASAICRSTRPALQTLTDRPDHSVACHLVHNCVKPA